jgi:hypothetical protein
MFVNSITKTKYFRRLSHEEKVFLLLIVIELNSCGVTVIDIPLLEFVASVEDGDQMIQSFQEKGILHYDRDTEEVMFYGYLMEHNPFSGTRSHQIKFRSDGNKIKSDYIRTTVTEAAVQAAKIIKEPKQQDGVKAPAIDR